MTRNPSILLALAAGLTVAACEAEPEVETTDTDNLIVAEPTPVGDGAAPELANVQSALMSACAEPAPTVAAARCEAIGLGGEFTCDYTLEGEDEGRDIVLTEVEGIWTAAEGTVCPA